VPKIIRIIISRRVKAEYLLALISSGEVVVVGSRSTRVIDISLEFVILNVGACKTL
jgi:hypothetical protein